MSFWNTSTNEKIESTTEYEQATGFEPIPDGTRVLGAVKKASWETNNFNGDYIQIQWDVLAPSEHKNRVVFQNIKINDEKEATADKAKRMLAAIDANAGGKLMKSDEVPTDAMLAKALTAKQMVLKLQVWEMEGDDGQKRSGNWVSAVSPKKAGTTAKAAPKEEPVIDTGINDDGIPF